MDPALAQRLRAIVGPEHGLDDPAAMAPYLADQRGRFQADCPLVLRPGRTGEVAAILAACQAAGQGVVPQGGNTGLVGGGLPLNGEVLVSLERLNRIRSVDAADFTLVAEAGCILADVQAAAAEADRLFPLSLAAEGSARIGGLLSTNAGGTQVLRYGNARDLVLGLEVALADGRIWHGLRALRKDNTGYDLTRLFLGAEGTLGIITAAVLKLFPRPHAQVTGLVAVRDPAAAVALLADLRTASGDGVTSFELMSGFALDIVLRHIPGSRRPLADDHAWLVLTDIAAPRADDLSRQAEALEAVLADHLEAGTVTDATIAQNARQAGELWHLRESIPEAQKREGGSIKHDVSVPVSQVPTFLDQALALVTDLMPGVRPCPFGHVGDGNIHFNLTQPAAMDRDAFMARAPGINERVHDLVHDLGGSFSAEHGIGRLKRDAMARYRDPLERELMARIKGALDPAGIVNPGAVVDSGR